MRQKHLFHPFALILLAGVFQGCTAIGYGIGAMIDGKSSDVSPGADSVPLFPNIKANAGRITRIEYADSMEFATFLGDSVESDSSYRHRSANFGNRRRTMPAVAPGDTIVVWRGHRESLDADVGCVKEFDPTYLVVQRPTSWDFIPYSKLDSMRRIGSSASISRAALLAQFEANALPIGSRLYFRSKARQFSLTNSDFQNAHVFISHKAAVAGAVLGLIADIAAIVAISANGHFKLFEMNLNFGNWGNQGVDFGKGFRKLGR